MKLFFALFAITLFSFSCSKSGSKPEVQYLGKWKSTNYFYSAGGPVIFRGPDSDADFVEFRIGGTFISNMRSYDFDSYKIQGNNRATLFNTVTRTSMDVEFSMHENKLTITWLNYDEGLGNVFMRQ